MRLWIAEKPDAGRNIAKALGGGHDNSGKIVLSNGDIVTWAIGHLLESLMPEDYNAAYRYWRLEDLPIIPERFRWKPIGDKRGQLATVVGLIKQASEVVVATDSGREGELIARIVMDFAGWKGPVKRFWTSSLTPSALSRATANLLDGNEKLPLYIAARLRGSIDWLDGINYSRLINLRAVERGDKPVSVGRVQTATLALVVDRDAEIEDFTASDYFDVKAVLATSEHRIELWHAPRGDDRMTDRTKAEAIAAQSANQAGTLAVAAKPKNFSPPPPYSLPELQIHASAVWGWGSDRTLDVLQKLYEASAVTYPRTDSGCLTQEMQADIPRHLAALARRTEYRNIVAAQPTFRKSVFDDSKVGDHHGIIPTDEAVDLQRFGSDAAQLFDMIARRFIAAMLPDAQGTTTTVETVLAGYRFKTAGTIITVPGWKAAWDGFGDPDETPDARQDQADDSPPQGKILPPVKDKDGARAVETAVVTRTTRPPPRFTEGSLIKAMMAAGSKNPDAEIRDLLSNGGLGTGATRQEIVKNLKQRSFIVNRGKQLISTQRGRELIGIVRADGNKLADVVATAQLERELRQVEQDPAHANLIWQQVTSQLRAEIQRLVSGPPSQKLTPIAAANSAGGTTGPTRGNKRPANRGSKPAKRPSTPKSAASQRR